MKSFQFIQNLILSSKFWLKFFLFDRLIDEWSILIFFQRYIFSHIVMGIKISILKNRLPKFCSKLFLIKKIVFIKKSLTLQEVN